jgi:hypothetical protein
MNKPIPLMYWVIGFLLTFWGLAGCYACYMQFIHGAEAMGPATAYDHALFEGLPVWYNYCYAVAVVAGLAGGFGLLMRQGWAGIAFLISLTAAIIQFGYLFVTTDIIVKKGAEMVLPFPLFVIAVAFGAMWFTVHAFRKDWVS